MPVMDGPECVRELRKHEGRSSQAYHQLVIGMSANTDEECKMTAFEAGVDYFVQKPFSIPRLQELIKQYYGIDSYAAEDTGGDMVLVSLTGG